ncbi:MAG: peptidylprolyl isomerase, partial [Chitinophagaceae bacterium]
MKYAMKYWVFSLLFMFSYAARTQTLFSFGPNKVSRQEFLKAYAKNNLEATPQLQTYRDYLDLYVRFKLKVQAALDMRLDTSAQQREELSSFRNQITENYLTDQETLNLLIEEAMNRVQQDIQVGHIFIAVRDKATPEEESRARDKALTLYDRLQNGEDFGKLAAENSDDPSGRERQGDLGYITCFTLPYEFETAIYSLAPGSVGRPFRSKLGFHLFKHMGQRPAFGRIKVAHILIGFPPQPTDEQRKAAHLLADSLYLLLKQGADFKDLALSHSTDNL